MIRCDVGLGSSGEQVELSWPYTIGARQKIGMEGPTKAQREQSYSGDRENYPIIK
jgi:hypothetical protein